MRDIFSDSTGQSGSVLFSNIALGTVFSMSLWFLVNSTFIFNQNCLTSEPNKHCYCSSHQLTGTGTVFGKDLNYFSYCLLLILLFN